jgi:hypothetical protein
MSTVNAIGLSSNSTNESSVLDRIPKQTLGQEDLAGLRADQQVLQANALLGRLVVLQSGDGSEIVGEVSAVQVHSGKVEIVVDGNSYQLNQLSAIVPKPVDSQPQE